MLSPGAILHPTDFSELSDYAFGLACALARAPGARVVVLHVGQPPVVAHRDVRTPPPQAGDYRQALADQLRRIRAPAADVAVEHRLEEGEPAEVIPQVAREIGADLILLGTHGRTGLERLLLGSVAEEVARKAPCPVVSVRVPGPETPAAQEARTTEVVQA
jgi:nucleotide-binding universal stress UspA family protein